jgi:hypothetical protein
MIYSDARLKIERANKHIDELNAIVRSLPDRYIATIERNEEARCQRIKHEFPDAEAIALNLSLIIGDAFHNLRTALDYAWLRTLERLTPSVVTDRSKFPAYKTLQDLEGALKGIKIDVASPALYKRTVSDIQPYEAGNYHIFCLHSLDISDKHQLLIPLVHVAAIVGIVIEEPDGQISSGQSMAVEGPGPYLLDFEWDVKIKNKGKLSLSIAFEEGAGFLGVEVSGALPNFSEAVLHVVQLLENL